MRTCAVLAVMAVGLGGCASRSGDTPEEAQCEREANHEPNVQRLQDQMLGNISMQQELMPQVRAAKRQAFNDCMVRLGQPSQDVR
jgi:hypothetical protein